MAVSKSLQYQQRLADIYYGNNPHRIFAPPVQKYNVVGDRVEECKTIVVHEFLVSDAEDPDIHAAEPLYKWEKSEAGQWIMKNAAETPIWNRVVDPGTLSYKYRISAKLMGPALTEWLLRYSR
jgi:hypothetical protein